MGLVPLALFVAGRDADAGGAASARRGTALFAVVHFGVVLYWVPVALLWLSPAGVGVYLVGLILFAAAGATLGHLLHHAIHRLGAPVWLALPVGWTALEWGLAHLPGGVAYPWLGLGTTLTGFPALVGIAEVVGARGVGFWIALVNGLVVQLLLARAAAAGETPPEPDLPSVRMGVIGWAVVAATVVAFPMTWGVWRASTIEVWPVARVALLQTSLPQSIRMDPERVAGETRAALDRLTASIEPGSVDLVVTPEMLLPVVPDQEEAAGMRTYARELGAPILFGAIGHDGEGGTGARFNSVFLVDTGELSDFRWDKHHLVPLVERSLLFTPGLRGASSAEAGDFARGTGWPLADAASAAFGSMICFESAFPGIARGLRGAGADVLVNVTNDAWFGDDVGDARTAALWQHPAHLVMRAIETRAAVVRVGNAGFSFWIDPYGRRHDVIDLFREGSVIADVVTSDVETLYVRFGDLLGNACGVSGLLVLLASAMGAPGRGRLRGARG